MRMRSTTRPRKQRTDSTGHLDHTIQRRCKTSHDTTAPYVVQHVVSVLLAFLESRHGTTTSRRTQQGLADRLGHDEPFVPLACGCGVVLFGRGGAVACAGRGGANPFTGVFDCGGWPDGVARPEADGCDENDGR